MNVDSQTDNDTVLTLRELREDRGFSASRLAKLAGYANGSSVLHLERGAHPKLNHAVLMAQALNITPEHLAACIDESRKRTSPVDTATEENEAAGA